MNKKILIPIIVGFVLNLYAGTIEIDEFQEINNIKGSVIDLDSNTTSGLYYMFDNSSWFLYIKSSDYLLIHETGKFKVADGAMSYKASATYDSIQVSNMCVTFGNLIATNQTADLLAIANRQFCLSSDTISAIYHLYDKDRKLWMMYMPKNDYMLVHETGFNKTAEGAKAINNASTYFDGNITISSDPSGNGSTNTISFGSPSPSSENSDVPPSPPAQDIPKVN